MITRVMHLMLATAFRVISQTVLNARMLAVLLFLPSAILGLLSWVLSNASAFSQVGSAVFAAYPVLLVTGSAAIVLLRERRSGTLERLLALPLQRGTLIAGYLLAFIVTSTIQAAVTVTFLTTVVGLTTAEPAWTLVVVGTLSGALGTSIGLVVGLLARTEFEAIQLVAAIMTPQFFLSGALVPRADLPKVLESVSNWLPLTHTVQAARAVVVTETPWSLGSEGIAVGAFTIAMALLAVLLLRRRTA